MLCHCSHAAGSRCEPHELYALKSFEEMVPQPVGYESSSGGNAFGKHEDDTSDEHLSTMTVHAATAPSCLERQPQQHAMLSLSEVPRYESGMMKTRLTDLESARVSAAASTGSIGSILDAFMGRGGRPQRPTAAELWKGLRGGPSFADARDELGAAP